MFLGGTEKSTTGVSIGREFQSAGAAPLKEGFLTNGYYAASVTAPFPQIEVAVEDCAYAE